MSAGHVDVAAAAHAKLSEEVAREFADDLVRSSQKLGVDDFDRQCRDLARQLTSTHDCNAAVDELDANSSVKRWVDKSTGMCNTLISLDPLRDAKMWKVINHEVAHEGQQRTSDGQQPLSFTGLQAHAVVSILCDLDALIAGIRATGTVCETDDGVAIPPDTVRRLACDAHIVPMVLGCTGEVVDQGRRVRTATPGQRNTLAAMHKGCAYPGCPEPDPRSSAPRSVAARGREVERFDQGFPFGFGDAFACRRARGLASLDGVERPQEHPPISTRGH